MLLTFLQVSKLRMVTVWLAADLNTPAGRAVARAAVAHTKSSAQLRLGLLHNSDNEPGLVARLAQAALLHLAPTPAITLLSKLLKEDTAAKLMDGRKQLQDFDIPGLEMTEFLQQVAALDTSQFPIHRTFLKTALGWGPGKIGLMVNGRVLGPLKEGELLTNNDFDLLERLTMSQYGEKLVQAFHNQLDVQAAGVSDQAMLVAALLTARPPGKPRTEITYKSDQHSVVTVEPRMEGRPAFDIVAVVDPVSR